MRPLFSLLVVLSIASCDKPQAPSASVKPDAPAPAHAASSESVELTLADFTDTKGAAPSGGWTTEGDGTIHLTGKGGGSLISKNEYTNFELEWEWKLNEKGNNGIKYWVTQIGGKEWLGIEYQMIDDTGHPDGLRGGSHTTASIYESRSV